MLRSRHRAQRILVLTVSVSQGLIINPPRGGSLLGAARSQSKCHLHPMGRYLQAGTRPHSPQLEQQEAPVQGQGSGHPGCHIPHPRRRLPPQGGRSGGQSPGAPASCGHAGNRPACSWLKPLLSEGPCPGGLSPAPPHWPLPTGTSRVRHLQMHPCLTRRGASCQAPGRAGGTGVCTQAGTPLPPPSPLPAEPATAPAHQG